MGAVWNLPSYDDVLEPILRFGPNSGIAPRRTSKGNVHLKGRQSDSLQQRIFFLPPIRTKEQNSPNFSRPIAPYEKASVSSP